MSELTPALRAQTAPRRIADVDVRGRGRVVPLTLLAAAAVAAIWLVDISTGPDFGFAIFYLIPIGLASWWLGRASSVLIALLATVAWIWADLVARPSVLLSASLWNGLARASIFLSSSPLSLGRPIALVCNSSRSPTPCGSRPIPSGFVQRSSTF